MCGFHTACGFGRPLGSWSVSPTDKGEQPYSLGTTGAARREVFLPRFKAELRRLACKQMFMGRVRAGGRTGGTQGGHPGQL